AGAAGRGPDRGGGARCVGAAGADEEGEDGLRGVGAVRRGRARGGGGGALARVDHHRAPAARGDADGVAAAQRGGGDAVRDGAGEGGGRRGRERGAGVRG